MSISVGRVAGKPLAAILFLLLATVIAGCGGAAATATPTVRFGEFVTAKGLGDKNAPVNTTTTFNTGDVVYAVAKVDNFPQGSKVFSRWTIPTGNEDTGEITADRNYTDTYLEFHINGEGGMSLPAGSYTVTLFVDGNAGPKTQFTVR